MRVTDLISIAAAGVVSASVSACVTFSPQSQAITEAFFGDPDPKFEIDTPAFRRRSGFTRHAEMMAFLDRELVPHGAHVSILGRSQRGLSIPIVRFSSTATSGTPLRVWLQGGQHGDEPAGTEGLLLLMKKLATDPKHRALLRQLEITVVPMVNVDGYEVHGRRAANGLDLNRDQTKLLAPESRMLKVAFNAVEPEVAVDFHEYRSYRRDFIHFGRRGMTSLYDVMFLYSGNLNVPAPLRRWTADTFVAEAKAEMDARGLRHHDYVTTRRVHGDIHFNQGSTNARSSATSFALANTISTLIEVRGVALGRAGFRRRVLTTYWVALQHLRSAAEHADDIRAVLEKSKASRHPVTVLSERRVERQSLGAIDVAEVREIKLDVVVRNALASRPLLTRRRPFAYILTPQALAFVQRLRILGVRVDTLKTHRTIEAEGYLAVFREQDPLPYEGTYRQTVRTQITRQSVTFPPGTFVVRMEQPRANLAAEVLEPESVNSFVSFGVLEVEEGQQLPVYRGMNAFSID